MSYRRDVRYDPNSGVRVDSEQIPLPIEMVYNSYIDAVTNVNNQSGDETYFHNGPKHFNRIYFKYPPEWRTSNVGEKIIGVRNMKFNVRKGYKLEFELYIRKYRQDKFDELAKGLYPDDELDYLDNNQIQDVVNRMNRDDVHVYRIEYVNDIFDNIDDFIKNLYEKIDYKNIYNNLREDIQNSEQTNNEKIAALEQLDADKDNYYLMCLRNDVPFYLKRDDIDIKEMIIDNIMLSITSSPHNYKDFYFDFMITPFNIGSTYKKFYMWDDNKNEPLPYVVMNPGELDEDDQFDFDTANYFNIGNDNPNKNSIEYVTKFRRRLDLKNIISSLDCEVAASFASQSNRNIIGRTNEIFNPIKYYKLLDNDDKFWIEFYDRNEIDVPVTFNDFVMFTMDVVFLQNRKLLYS